MRKVNREPPRASPAIRKKEETKQKPCYRCGKVGHPHERCRKCMQQQGSSQDFLKAHKPHLLQLFHHKTRNNGFLTGIATFPSESENLLWGKTLCLGRSQCARGLQGTELSVGFESREGVWAIIFGTDWLEAVQLDWKEIRRVTDLTLEEMLMRYQELFQGDWVLGKDIRQH